MTPDTVLIAEVEAFLNSYDLPVIPVSNDVTSDKITESSVTASPEPRKRGRKKRNIDPTIKLELDRIKDRERCSRYRHRQRNERESLQREVKVLAAELAEAEKVRKELSTSTWKMIAQRELTARLSAEERQRQLCEAVEARAAYIREFQDMLQLQSKASNGVYNKRLRVETSDAAFYNVFVQDLDTIFAQTDEVIRACGLELVGDDNGVDSMRMWKEDNKTGFFLFTDNQLMPFNFDEACKALWHSAQLPHRQEDRDVFGGVEDPNTAAFKFRLSNRLSTGQVVSAVQRVVTRRYQQNGRMVLVWQSLMEGEGMFVGMRAGETGWDVLTPSTDAMKPGTVIRTCISHTPMHFTGETTHDPSVKQFTGLVLEKVAEDGVEIMKEFEKLRIADV